MKCSALPMRNHGRNRVMKCSPVPFRLQLHAEVSITWRCKAMHCTDCCSLHTHARNQVTTAWGFQNCTASVHCPSLFILILYANKQCQNTRSISLYCESVSGALKAMVSPSPHHQTALQNFLYSKDSFNAVPYLDHCLLWRNQSQSFAKRIGRSTVHCNLPVLNRRLRKCLHACQNKLWEAMLAGVTRTNVLGIR